jgi:hypothetical protein
MTDVEKIQQRKDVAADHDKAQEDLAAQIIKIERVADKLEVLATALKTHPEFVTGTPEIGKPDYREDLTALDRQKLLDDCSELRRLKDRARTTEKRLNLLNGRTGQSIVE